MSSVSLLSSADAWTLVRAATHDPAALSRATHVPVGDPQRSFVDLYLPLCDASASSPLVLGHLGQSLDGFIATHAGESQWVTGPENLVHMHRLRALVDAVIVGPGTVAADDPRLTTRLVDGPNPLRVVLDPASRLDPGRRVFADGAAPTLLMCAAGLVAPGETRIGQAEMLGVPRAADSRDELDLHVVLDTLRRRGCTRVFVEGGGRTVSAFLQAGLLTRLHVTVAPVIIGDGRPGIRVPPVESLQACPRPVHAIYRMGGDVLFDFQIGTRAPLDAAPNLPIQRVI